MAFSKMGIVAARRLIAPVALLCVTASGALPQGLARGPRWAPCLMSVSFAVPLLGKWEQETVRAAGDSPYCGIAVRLATPYALGPAPRPEDFGDAVQLLKTYAPGKVWPWVFLNRIVADSPSGRNPRAQRPGGVALTGFSGADIDGAGGALPVFLETWRTALRLAKEVGAPGIVFDPEAYTDYGVYRLSKLAELRGVSLPDVRDQVAALGATLADITAEEYPGAVVLTLFTLFDRDLKYPHLVPTLFAGMLREAERKGLPLTLVDGGETVGYCVLDMNDLARKQGARVRAVGDMLRTYPEHFALAATLAPWADPSVKTGNYAQRTDCRDSSFRTAADFKTPLVDLLRRYGYAWVYGAAAVSYNPLDAGDRAVFDPVLSDAIKDATRLGPLTWR